MGKRCSGLVCQLGAITGQGCSGNEPCPLERLAEPMTASAAEIAALVCGGPPVRCYGWKAKIYNAAYEAAALAILTRPPTQ